MDVFNERFAGIARLYGHAAVPHLQNMNICVVGLGGVGSWVVEALARTGVGHITGIDFDDIALSNVNRQVHTLTSTVGVKKNIALQQRVFEINPTAKYTAVDDFINEANLAQHLSPPFDYVIDAIDSIKFKAALIYHCKRNKIPIITTGGAGGLTDPSQIVIADLSRTYHDALAAKVRGRLRSEYSFSKNPDRRFGVECVFSTQQKVYPQDDGGVSCEKPGLHGVSLDCRFGYGAATFITATFGFFAAARVINKVLAKHSKIESPSVE